MPNPTANLALPNILGSQAQKHVTHNEALRLLDGIVQLGVLNRTLTAPPGSPAEGDRHVVAGGATGLWAGWDGSVAFWTDGAWFRLVPRPGWLAHVAAENALLVWTGSAWTAPAALGAIPDTDFGLVDDGDPTKKVVFELSGIATGTTRTLTLPDVTGEIAVLAGSQSFTGAKTFAGTLTVSAAAASLGTATGDAAYGLGTGITASGNTKSVDIGTGGAAGSTTLVTLGPVTAGAAGQMVINTALVTFASQVTDVSMPAANLTALHLGLGGASADASNRLSVNAPATLLNHAGAGHEVTVNKAAAGDDASLAFKTGFSARALAGLLGSDDFTLKVSPDGSSFLDGLVADRNTGRVRLLAGLALDALAGDPGAPADGWLWHNGATGQLRARIGGMTRILADQDVPWLAPSAGDHALTTTGAGAATATQAGAANRMEIYPFIPRGDLEGPRWSPRHSARSRSMARTRRGSRTR